MNPRELKAAIRAAGGTKQLALLLGTTQRTVQRWTRRGPPSRGAVSKRFEQLEKERKNSIRLAREERAIFDALFKEAGELGRLPRALSRVRHREGPRTFGTRYILAINRMVNPAILPKVKAWAVGIPGRPILNVWQGQVMSTQYALPAAFDPNSPRADFRGYQSARTVEQMSSPRSGDFGVGLLQATPRAQDKAQAVKLISNLITELQNSHELMVFIHSVTLFNYRFRTDTERKQWETEQRNKRRKQKELRDKKKRLSKKTSKKPAKKASKKTPKKPSGPKSKQSSKRSTAKKKPSRLRKL